MGQSEQIYSQLLKEVYAAARKENWSAKKVREMLADPLKFEHYLKTVSLLWLTLIGLSTHRGAREKWRRSCPFRGYATRPGPPAESDAERKTRARKALSGADD